MKHSICNSMIHISINDFDMANHGSLLDFTHQPSLVIDVTRLYVNFECQKNFVCELLGFLQIQFQSQSCFTALWY